MLRSTQLRQRVVLEVNCSHVGQRAERTAARREAAAANKKPLDERPFALVREESAQLKRRLTRRSSSIGCRVDDHELLQRVAAVRADDRTEPLGDPPFQPQNAQRGKERRDEGG